MYIKIIASKEVHLDQKPFWEFVGHIEQECEINFQKEIMSLSL
jgi:hypothetical protein